MFGWGQTAAPRAPLHLARQDQRPDDLGQRAGGAADRHDLREPVRRGRQRRTRLFFSGGSDGAMHALKIATGEPVWHWDVSKRGLNTAALMVGTDVIVTHSEENIDVNEMGMLAAVPAASKGTLTDKDARWIVRDVQAGLRVAGLRRRADLPRRQRRDPVRLRRQGRQAAVDARSSGRSRNPRRCSPTASCMSARRTASSTSSDRTPTKREVLDEANAARHATASPRQSSPSPAVARGRVYVVSMDGDVCDRPEGHAEAERRVGSGPSAPTSALLLATRRRCSSRRPN